MDDPRTELSRLRIMLAALEDGSMRLNRVGAPEEEKAAETRQMAQVLTREIAHLEDVIARGGNA